MRIAWLNAATRSLRAIHAHIAADNPPAARRVVKSIAASVARLARFPQAGRAGQMQGTLELVIPGLPYPIVYRVRQDRVEILCVFHPAMNWPAVLS